MPIKFPIKITDEAEAAAQTAANKPADDHKPKWNSVFKEYYIGLTGSGVSSSQPRAVSVDVMRNKTFGPLYEELSKKVFEGGIEPTEKSPEGIWKYDVEDPRGDLSVVYDKGDESAEIYLYVNADRYATGGEAEKAFSQKKPSESKEERRFSAEMESLKKEPSDPEKERMRSDALHTAMSNYYLPFPLYVSAGGKIEVSATPQIRLAALRNEAFFESLCGKMDEESGKMLVDDPVTRSSAIYRFYHSDWGDYGRSEATERYLSKPAEEQDDFELSRDIRAEGESAKSSSQGRMNASTISAILSMRSAQSGQQSKERYGETQGKYIIGRYRCEGASKPVYIYCEIGYSTDKDYKRANKTRVVISFDPPTVVR